MVYDCFTHIIVKDIHLEHILEIENQWSRS